jgi:hypothetical protein
VTGLLIDGNGRPYCPMSGHAERDCPGYPTPEHMALSNAGIGWSSVPGPSGAELRDEMRADWELMADEYHGRDLNA